MEKRPRICGVILAAGASSRMGRDKALLPWPPTQPQTHGNSTFLSSAIYRLREQTDLVVVVAGKNAGALEPAVRENSAILCVNANPELGQFSSIKAGLKEARERGFNAAMIAPVDRPPISEATLAYLHEKFVSALEEGYWAAIPEFRGKHGHPLALGTEMMDEFLSAPLTSTGRDVIHANAEHVLYVAVDDPAAVMNVNTWEEYQKLTERG